MQFDFITLEKAAWEAGVSLTQLCIHADVNRATPTRWKNGTAKPSARLYKRLLDKAEELKKNNPFRT